MVERGRRVVLVVREYEPEKDLKGVEEVERRCEVGPTGKLSLYTDLLGDPLCRVRHSPASLMLVAETMTVTKGGGIEREIVGMIRGCIKTVTCGTQTTATDTQNGDREVTCPVYAKVAYILGLRVSPFHRRMGIGLNLVQRMEQWFIANKAEYSYIATENDNEPSVDLFTRKCGYSKFRSPSILVNPVFAHRITLTRRVTIIKLTPSDAESLYRHHFSATEFFPSDIDSVLQNPLTIGTYIAVPRGSYTSVTWPGSHEFLNDPPKSWAVLSVWNSNEVFKLEVRGASRFRKALAKLSRAVDKTLPWLQLPSVPKLFGPFGLHFLYGLGGEGPNAVKLIEALCRFAHNLAKDHDCSVVATEVSSCEPLRSGVPHWKVLSCNDDLWCVKKLMKGCGDMATGDWIESCPGLSIFVDPREF